jgi:hypothetical protein
LAEFCGVELSKIKQQKAQERMHGIKWKTKQGEKAREVRMIKGR